MKNLSKFYFPVQYMNYMYFQVSILQSFHNYIILLHVQYKLCLKSYQDLYLNKDYSEQD